jgi:hypothetical protein
MINIFDISDAAHPTMVGTFYDTSLFNSGSAFQIVVSGNYLYLAATKTGPTINSNGFKIIDVSNPMNPTKVGQFNITNQMCSDIAIVGSYAYACYGSLGLIVADVSNPSAPVQAGSLILTGGFPASAISVSGNRAYVTDNAGQLHIIDLTNATSPVDIGTFQLADVAYDIYAEGNYAYVAEGNQGLQIVDVSVPASPLLAGYYPPASSTNAVYKQGNYAYIADSQNGMQVIDVSNPAAPFQAGYFFDIAIDARNVYADNLHSYLAADEGLYIFNGGVVLSTGNITVHDNPVSIYPNPSSGKFEINLKSDHSNSSEIKIYDTIGKEIYSSKESQLPLQIDLTEQPKGIYFIKIKSGNRIFSEKIAVM